MEYLGQKYFPPGALNTDSHVDEGIADVYATFLKMADERPLADASVRATRYRFFSMEPEACVVRLEQWESGWMAICKSAAEAVFVGQYDQLRFRTLEQEISQRSVEKLKALADAAGYWSMPIAEPPGGLDGWRGVVEYVNADQYKIVDRWCPDGTPFGRFCNWFLNVKRETFGEQTLWSRVRSLLGIG